MTRQHHKAYCRQPAGILQHNAASASAYAAFGVLQSLGLLTGNCPVTACVLLTFPLVLSGLCKNCSSFAFVLHELQLGSLSNKLIHSEVLLT